MKPIIQGLLRLVTLINSQTTGTSVELKKTLGITQYKLDEYLVILRELGAHISYSRTKKSFYFTKPGQFTIEFKSTLQAQDGDEVSYIPPGQNVHQVA